MFATPVSTTIADARPSTIGLMSPPTTTRATTSSPSSADRLSASTVVGSASGAEARNSPAGSDAEPAAVSVPVFVSPPSSQPAATNSPAVRAAVSKAKAGLRVIVNPFVKEGWG